MHAEREIGYFLTQRITGECAKIVGHEMLLHQVLEHFVKCINICIATDGKMLKVLLE